ncbi:IclR family transcriptional regulator [Gordonia phthalatica]|uniref:IclR family transcriptional regulator n=1 Tax=Gordonia phthalatica TaxID=1136941 RepID=A0A0N9N6G8_9ACTN|nr:IclR family transcriptional regulator [Gordonia phthalatica]ALG86131.1 IclR family transcriptional regulator [Gordonia phthalatica]
MTADAAKFAPAPEHTDPPQYPIESVDNALRLLWLLSSRKSLRLTDASQYLGVASSTAHRALAMLQYRGFVKQNPTTRAYEAGPSLDTIALALLRRLDIRDQARPALERLNQRSDETVHLGTLDRATVHFLVSIESSKAVRVASRSGRSMPAHCTSTGKAMLSLLTDDQVIALYPTEELEQLTPASVATRSELLNELAAVRRRGYAYSDEESEDGVCSVAAPVAGASTPAAINISVPVNRMNAKRRKELAALLRESVEEVEAALG